MSSFLVNQKIYGLMFIINESNLLSHSLLYLMPEREVPSTSVIWSLTIMHPDRSAILSSITLLTKIPHRSSVKTKWMTHLERKGLFCDLFLFVLFENAWASARVYFVLFLFVKSRLLSQDIKAAPISLIKTLILVKITFLIC